MRPSRRDLILIIFLLLFCAVSNYFWIKEDTANQGFDVPVHTDIAVTVHQGLTEILRSGDSFFAKCQELFKLSTEGILIYPRLVHFVAAVAALPFQDFLSTFRYTNITYFILLVVGIYLLGRKIHSSTAGLIAAYFIVLYPAIFGTSRKFGLDFPLAAFLCLVLYFLLKSDAFKNRKWSIIFGIGLGVGSLIKGQIVFYVIGPLIYGVFLGLKNSRKKSIPNMMISLLFATSIALLWWHRISTLEGLTGLDQHLSYGKNPNTQVVASHFLFNLKAYLTDTKANLSPLFFGVFLTGLLFCLRKLDQKITFIVLWFFTSYGILFFIPTTVDRFIIPTFGAVALISAIGWLEAPLKKNVKFTLVILFIILGTIQLFAVSFYKKLPALANTTWAYPPQKDNYQFLMEEFNALIRQNKPTSEVNIGIIETQRFHGDGCISLKYRLNLLNTNNKVYLSGDGYCICKVVHSFLSYVDSYDFLIATSETNEPNLAGLLECGTKTYENFTQKVIQVFRGYQVIKKEQLYPDDLAIFLLKRPEE